MNLARSASLRFGGEPGKSRSIQRLEYMALCHGWVSTVGGHRGDDVEQFIWVRLKKGARVVVWCENRDPEFSEGDSGKSSRLAVNSTDGATATAAAEWQ